jgi:predicted ATPase
VNNERQLKIAFMGGPGVGKTKLMDEFGKEGAAIVNEAARDYFKLNPDVDRRSLITQSLLLEEIIEREKVALASGKKLTVCDRATLDPIAYIHHYGMEDVASQLFKDFLHHLPSYQRLYLLDPVGVPYVQDKERTETEEERMQIHEAFLFVLGREGVEYQLLSGSVEERVMQVNQHIDLLRA